MFSVEQLVANVAFDRLTLCRYGREAGTSYGELRRAQELRNRLWLTLSTHLLNDVGHVPVADESQDSSLIQNLHSLWGDGDFPITCENILSNWDLFSVLVMWSFSTSSSTPVSTLLAKDIVSALNEHISLTDLWSREQQAIVSIDLE